MVERVATGGSVALTFQASFKQNRPALYSESTAHPDRKKKTLHKHSLLSLRYTEPMTGSSNRSRSVQTAAKANLFKRKEKKKPHSFFIDLRKKKKKNRLIV